MDKAKVLVTTTDLKLFFEKRKLTVSEVHESLFRLIDYIDEHYDEDNRDKIFINGSGLGNLVAQKNI